MPTWVRRPVPRQYRRSRTFWRPPVSTGTFDTHEFNALPAGVTGLLLFDPAFAAVSSLAGPIIPLAWKTSRYQNRVGSWEAEISLEDQLIGTTPVHEAVRRGWHVCLIQEGNYPEHDNTKEYLLYMGIVLDREYAVDEASARLRLSGAMRTHHLVERRTIGNLSVTNQLISALASQLVDGSNIIGSPGGIIQPNHPNRKATLTFSNKTRYAALLEAARLGRLSLRETWDFDRPELVEIDGPPDSGITLVNAESYDPGMGDAEDGFGHIAGRPTIRYDGTSVVTRVIPEGSDTPAENGPLTLQYSDKTSPYTIQNATDESGATYYYIADSEAETAYGRSDHRLVRAEVKNPNDNAATRRLAANTLYATAVDTLIRNRSEHMFVRVAVANGNNIWALPGDMMRLDYQGWVDNEAGNVVWQNINNRRFMVAERHDSSDPSGVRMVEFTLAAPELEFEIPGLPDAIVLPPLTPPWEEPPVPDELLEEEGADTEIPNSGQLPGDDDGAHEDNTPTSSDPGAPYFDLPSGVIRTNDDVLEYWDGANWQNLADSLSISDPGGGRVWLSAT